jgi:exodeoxyribonuclease VII small subunit
VTAENGRPRRARQDQDARPDLAFEPELSYEQARAELAAVVEKLEAGGATLEDSLALWERGEQLAAICQRWLDGARARLSPPDEAT